MATKSKACKCERTYTIRKNHEVVGTMCSNCFKIKHTKRKETPVEKDIIMGSEEPENSEDKEV